MEVRRTKERQESKQRINFRYYDFHLISCVVSLLFSFVFSFFCFVFLFFSFSLDVPVIDENAQSGFIRGNPLFSSDLNLFTKLYTEVDASIQYAFVRKEDGLATQRVAATEADFAIVSTAALTDEQIDMFTAPVEHIKPDGSSSTQSGGLIFPAFLTGVVVTFNLPLEVMELHANWSVDATMGLPALFPLRGDLDLFAMLFAGVVGSWTDAKLLDFNPQLREVRLRAMLVNF